VTTTIQHKTTNMVLSISVQLAKLSWITKGYDRMSWSELFGWRWI